MFRFLGIRARLRSLTGAATVTVTRYRYRGKNIPNPWNQQPLKLNNTG